MYIIKKEYNIKFVRSFMARRVHVAPRGGAAGGGQVGMAPKTSQHDGYLLTVRRKDTERKNMLTTALNQIKSNQNV